MTIHLPDDVERDLLAHVDRGRFASVDEAIAAGARLLLDQIDHAEAATEPPSATEAPPPDVRKPIWERILERTAKIPDEEWDKLPVDLAEQHDHYLYGTPKRPTTS